MGNNIAALRKMETDALKGDGVIDFQEAKDLAKTAVTKQEKAVVSGMLANDNFRPPKKDAEKKELTKLLGGTTLPRSSPLAGQEIPGVKGAVIQRVLGDTGGYGSKHHAIAAARAAGLDNAMVVKGPKDKWYAVESDRSATGAKGSAGTIKDVLHVGKLDRATFDSLKTKIDGKTGAALKEAWKELAAYATGVPKNEVKVLFKGDTPENGKVNINLDPAFNPEGRVPGFDPNKPEYVELGPKAFDRPANAVATLAHEEVHAQHYRDTLELYGDYKKSKSHDSFRMWAAKNIKGSKDPGIANREVMKADIVAGFEDGAFAATELFAYVEAAKIAFQSGDLTQARTDLNKVRNLDVLPLNQTQSVAQEALRELRDRLPDGARDVFDDVVNDAKHGVLKGL